MSNHPDQISKLGELPQKPVSWYMTIRRLHTWLELEDGSNAQPFVLLIIHLEMEAIVGLEFLTTKPHDEQIRRLVAKYILHPPKEISQDPHRPESILSDDQSITMSMEIHLKPLGIEVDTQPPPPTIAQMIAETKDMLAGHEPSPPGLLTVAGVNPEMIGGLFSAAADFYRVSPWAALKDIQPLKIHLHQFEVDLYVQLMGAAGLEHGVVVYMNWDDLIHSFNTAYDPLDQLPPGGWRSLTFETADLIPREDRDAIEEYGWRIAAEDAHPLVITYTKTSVERPTRDEILYFEAIMRAIPLFLRNYLQTDGEGDYLATEQHIQVEVYSGPMSLNIPGR